VLAYLFVIQTSAWRLNSEINVGCSLVVSDWFVRSYSVLKKCIGFHYEDFLFPMARQPVMGQGVLIVEASRSHSDTHIHTCATVGRTPLEKWSARRTDLFLTTHSTLNRQTSLLPAGFEPTIPASEPPPRRHWNATRTYFSLSFVSLIKLDRNLVSSGCAACHGRTTPWRDQHHLYNSNITQKTASLWPAVASLLRSCSLGIIILPPNSEFVSRYTNRNIEIQSVWVNVVHVHTFDKWNDKFVLTFYIRWRSAIL
jgi:hypothetical protein